MVNRSMPLRHGVLESWVMEGSEGDSVAVDAYLPPDPRFIVVAGHGADNSRKAQYIRVGAKAWIRHDIAVVAADAPFHGDRVQDVPMGMPGLEPAVMARSVRDQRRLIDALEHRFGSVPIGYMGFSMGTLFGVPLMAADDRVRAGAFLIAGSTRVSYPSRFQDLGPEDLEALEVSDPAVFAPLVGPRPVLMIHADRDELVPLEAAVALYEAFDHPKELVVLPGTHTEWRGAARWFRRLRSFFEEVVG